VLVWFKRHQPLQLGIRFNTIRLGLTGSTLFGVLWLSRLRSTRRRKIHQRQQLLNLQNNNLKGGTRIHTGFNVFQGFISVIAGVRAVHSKVVGKRTVKKIPLQDCSFWGEGSFGHSSVAYGAVGHPLLPPSPSPSEIMHSKSSLNEVTPKPVKFGNIPNFCRCSACRTWLKITHYQGLCILLHSKNLAARKMKENNLRTETLTPKNK